jgi:hypothetical protein
MKKISKNITYFEAIYSDTAKRKGIKNEPNPEQIKNMKAIAKDIFQPLREWVGGAIKITSFFRSKKLNGQIGGSSTSHHMCLDGFSAMDIDDVYGHKTNAEMFEYIRENLNFDTLIWEFGDDENPAWIHVSSNIDKKKNRQRVLKAVKDKYKTNYLTL